MTFQSFKLTTGIINAMIDAKLDPQEFYAFMKKYASFIKLGMVMKKFYAAGTPEFDEINKAQALTAGTQCFDAFLIDFEKDFQRAKLLMKRTKKEAK